MACSGARPCVRSRIAARAGRGCAGAGIAPPTARAGPRARRCDTGGGAGRAAAAGGRCRITGSLEHGDARSDLAPAAAAASEGEAWTIAAPFTARGAWRVRIVAYRDAATLETYEKLFTVAPTLPEGARLPRDDAG